MSTTETVRTLDERDANQLKLDNQRRLYRAAQANVRAKSAALKVAEINHSDLVAAVAALQKVTRAFGEIPHSALAKLRSGGSSDPLTPALRIAGPTLREIVDSTAVNANSQVAAAAQDVERIRGELSQAEADVSTIGARVDALAAQV